MENSQRLPFSLSLNKVGYVPPQMSEDLTLFFLISGTVTVVIGEKKKQLYADDLVVVNPFQYYQIESTESNLLLILRVAKAPILSHFRENWLPFIECSSVGSQENDTEKFQKLRESVAHLMAVYFKNNHDSELEIYQHLFTVLNYLVKEFKADAVFAPKLIAETLDDRISQLVEIIQNDYDQPLSLEKLAERSGISYYHLSRSFKKQIGITFTEYVNQIRLIHATEALILSSQPIVKVALNNGFSSMKNFHQVFKKHYDMTPSVYRKKHSLMNDTYRKVTKEADYQKISDVEAVQELAKYLVAKDIQDENAAVEQQLTLIMPKDYQTEYYRNKKIIKIGPANEGLTSYVQRELRTLQKELSFDLIQFEGFCQETNFDEDVLLISEYILNNQWFDLLVEIQLKPMIQFSMPLQYTDKEKVKLWCDKQLAIIRHFLNRYGLEEVNQWYIEWSMSKESKCWVKENLWGYHYFYRKLKQMVPNCRVGFMTLRSLDEEEFKQYNIFISEQKEQQCLPDFISFHADPYSCQEVKENYSWRFKNYQQKILARVKSVVKQVNIQEPINTAWRPELFLTDWNTLVGEGNTFSGTFFRSALILESVIELSKEVTGIAFWLNIKVKERQTHNREDSSLSVFLYGELRRPLFFSLSFLNHLKGELIAEGSGYILTRSKGQYQLLLYNSSYLDPQYSVDTFQVQYQTKKIQINLKDLPSGDYLIREYILDKDHGGIYNDWIRVGGQTEIDHELQKYLEQKIMPRFELKNKAVPLSGYSLETILTLNACQLYLIQPIY